MPVIRRYYGRRELTAKLRELGYPIGDSTLVKLCSPSVDKGPPLAALDGRRHLYRLRPAIRWAEARLRRPDASRHAHDTNTNSDTNT